MVNHKKKIKLMLLLVLVFTLLFSVACSLNTNNSKKDNTETEGTQEDASREGEYLSYENIEHGIDALYPSDWEFKEDIMGSLVTFLSPQENEKDLFRENINITLEDLSEYQIDLKQYNELSIQQLKQFITNIEILSNTTYDGLDQDAYQITFTGKQGQLDLKWKSIIFLKDKKAYIITYSADIEHYDEYLSYFEEIVNSLGY